MLGDFHGVRHDYNKSAHIINSYHYGIKILMLKKANSPVLNILNHT